MLVCFPIACIGNRIDDLHTNEMDQELSNRPETTSLC